MQPKVCNLPSLSYVGVKVFTIDGGSTIMCECHNEEILSNLGGLMNKRKFIQQEVMKQIKLSKG